MWLMYALPLPHRGPLVSLRARCAKNKGVPIKSDHTTPSQTLPLCLHLHHDEGLDKKMTLERSQSRTRPRRIPRTKRRNGHETTLFATQLGQLALAFTLLC